MNALKVNAELTNGIDPKENFILLTCESCQGRGTYEVNDDGADIECICQECKGTGQEKMTAADFYKFLEGRNAEYNDLLKDKADLTVMVSELQRICSNRYAPHEMAKLLTENVELKKQIAAFLGHASDPVTGNYLAALQALKTSIKNNLQIPLSN